MNAERCVIDYVVGWFASGMRKKMLDKVPKRGLDWIKEDQEVLLQRIKDEYKELMENVCIDELIDLANQCMLLADSLRMQVPDADTRS